MAIAFCFNPSLSAFSNPNHPYSSSSSSSSSPLLHLRIAVSPPTPILRHHHPTLPVLHAVSAPSDAVLAGGGGDDHGNSSNNNNNGGNNGGDGWGEAENAGDKNREEALMVLAGAGRVLESLPKDLKSAIEAGRLPGAVVEKFLELEKFGVLRWLMQFGGFKERLLADDLFLAKVFMECGVGIFTKTAAEYERRREKFFDELEIVFADVVMAIIADFMLVYLPAPTVALRPPLGTSAGAIAKFFHNCPDNAFQVALAGTSYSFLQRFGAIVGNGTKLFAVGTASSLVGTAVTNALINARKAVDKAAGVEVEKQTLPILSTSAAYGVYMAVSSNLRYQVLAGVIEQRLLEPLLHKHKLMLGAISFAVRTGNTFLGSLLWVDYARWLGLQ
ncbi:protein RETICULATA-RELATED 4, chloroplastic-like [Corylus avellana]|uniref:protein RETICULATA-RELATED 4, chloroplastic-like n=1 Tax=Corylus avellana TaxID=13451 RepID=UPI00286D2D8F|nr:protein RETICULATA-RELATED 4, chloroplastic-like [Corylus avellana]